MMDSPQPKQRRVDLEQKLVSDLQALRDTLTHLSLMLNDLKFSLDSPQRQAVFQLTADCIVRSQASQH